MPMEESKIFSLRIINYEVAKDKGQSYTRFAIEVVGAVDYVNCPNKISRYCILSRYSKIRDLHKKLLRVDPRIESVLPPRKIIGNRSSGFINGRICQLNKYFRVLLENAELKSDQKFTEFFSPTNRNFLVVGCRHVGKQKFVNAFYDSYRRRPGSPVDITTGNNTFRVSLNGLKFFNIKSEGHLVDIASESTVIILLFSDHVTGSFDIVQRLGELLRDKVKCSLINIKDACPQIITNLLQQNA